MTDNFWGYVLEGVSQVILLILHQLPEGAVNSLIGNAATTLYFGMAPILFFIGPFMNLELLALEVSAIIVLESVKVILAVYRWILKLIPAAG